MQTRLNPYISFDKEASEAIDFYQSIFGGKIEKTSFKDGGMPHELADAEKIMHAMLTADNDMVLMASDAPSGMERDKGSSISISLSGDNQEELQGYYEKLSEGGEKTLPLEKAPWGDWFGMCTDKYGVSWMVNISGAGK